MHVARDKVKGILNKANCAIRKGIVFEKKQTALLAVFSIMIIFLWEYLDGNFSVKAGSFEQLIYCDIGLVMALSIKINIPPKWKGYISCCLLCAFGK